MSMLSSQIDELRQMADGGATYRDAREVMLRAADTITELRDDLQRANAENAKLREEFTKMDQWHSVELMAATDENAKLRTFLGGGSIVTDYWKDEDGTMHVLTTDGEHTYEYMRGGLADENAKLRELCKELVEFLTEAEWLQWPELRAEMRELRIEVKP